MPRATKNQKAILEELRRLYPNARPQLDFTTPFQLLVATILSAQCTDKRVNQVTPSLFAAYPDAKTMAGATPKEIEPLIHSCGFYHHKSRNIVAAAQAIQIQFNGEVPQDMDTIMSLPGVGRKTANVVLANAYGVPGIAVDTHVFRVSNRLGLANAKNVEDTEKQLMAVIPKEDWIDAHHWLIFHGRQVCAARKPACDRCTLRPYCKYAKVLSGESGGAKSKRVH